MAGAGGVRADLSAQLAPPAGAALSATLENVLLAFEPRVVMAAMHTTMMSASMTAYSTAVGTSSFVTNSTNFLATFRMGTLGWSGRLRRSAVLRQVQPSKPLPSVRRVSRSQVGAVQTGRTDFASYSPGSVGARTG